MGVRLCVCVCVCVHVRSVGGGGWMGGGLRGGVVRPLCTQLLPTHTHTHTQIHTNAQMQTQAQSHKAAFPVACKFFPADCARRTGHEPHDWLLCLSIRIALDVFVAQTSEVQSS